VSNSPAKIPAVSETPSWYPSTRLLIAARGGLPKERARPALPRCPLACQPGQGARALFDGGQVCAVVEMEIDAERRYLLLMQVGGRFAIWRDGRDVHCDIGQNRLRDGPSSSNV